MAAKHRNLVVHLTDGGTEGIPVKSTYRVPDLSGLEYLVVDAVDKSQVVIPIKLISKLHLKPPT
jgi:hypothetical protein